jgi:thiamine pyrophosphokinase
MSSHHIVRENQEPALLVADFGALDREDLDQILEWSPTVITDLANLDFFLAEEIKVDIVFGDKPEGTLQEAIKFLEAKENFVAQALSYLIDHNFKAVNIMSGDRVEATYTYAEEINIVIFCQGKRCAFFRNQFEKWKPKGEIIYVDEAYIKSFQGLDYLAKGKFGTIADGFVTIEFNTEDFVMVEEVI